MRKLFVLLLLALLPTGYSTPGANDSGPSSSFDSGRLYADMQLDGVVNFTAFARAIEGYNTIKGIRKEILTLIDFSKPSSEDRFFVFDLHSRKMLYRSMVAHGKNSGDVYATSFSNANGSNKSSLGFFLTDETYRSGRTGYSLKLTGLERGINDRALARGIVVHGADYCNPAFVARAGRLGRSLGCPALPEAVNRDVIDVIKDGSLLFIYANDRNYLSQSTILPHYDAVATL
ncbi:MAG: murein L,D-transpeptidase catalytic domain family protein [Rikenellaceae bacterium]|jgi:hypothetical protein|nr:murein L,D-transpeptidase catalytic domain family protein [Rikenellaceae bacterium]